MIDQWVKWQETMISAQKAGLDATKQMMGAQKGAADAMEANMKAYKAWLGMWGVK